MKFREFSLRLDRPLVTASGTIELREGFIVRLEDGGDDTTTALGEATPLVGWTETMAECRSALETAGQRFDESGQEVDLAALDDTPAARHGLCLALVNQQARRDGKPLYRFLGGDKRIEHLPVNETVSDGTTKKGVEEARQAVEAGFRCLKVKVGNRSVGEDLSRLDSIREAVGEEIELRADANGAWTRSQARQAFEAFSTAGVSLVEQPLPAEDLSGHERLRGGEVEVAIDESLAHHSIDDIIEARAADVVVLKPMVLGGPVKAHTSGVTARDAGLEVIVTTTFDAVVARTAAVHVAASLGVERACGLATASRLAEDLGPDPAPVEQGQVSVPHASGIGVEVPWTA